MKKKLLGFFVSVFGLYIAFGKLSFNDLFDVLRSVNWPLISLSMFIMILSVLVRSFRWKILLKPINNFEINNLFSSTMIGYFGNSVLPFKLGEYLRANALNKIYNSISVSTFFATIAIEKFLDLLGAFFLIIILIITNDIPIWFRNSFIVLILIMSFLFIFILFFGNIKKNFFVKSFSSFKKNNYLIKINLMINNFIDGLSTIRKLHQPFSVIFYTFLLWFMYWFSVWFCIIATDINISFLEAGIVLFATGMVIAIPSAPGYIGTFHATAVLILTDFFSISIDKSQAFAILNHFVGFFPMVIIGGVFFIKSSMSLSLKNTSDSKS